VARHVRKNRRFWDQIARDYQRKHGARLARNAMSWGVWRIPESRVRALGEVEGRDVLELGCGAARWSAALAARGARAVGIDVSGNQLAEARRKLARRRPPVELVQGSAEELPFRDEAFDVAFCDHGAMEFADPERTVPEAARVLRPGGVLAFSIASPLLFMCWNPKTEKIEQTLHGDYFRMRSDTYEESIQFQLPYGEWIRLFRTHGLEVEELIHLRPSPRATTSYDDYIDLEWARRWPAEDLWRVRKRRGDSAKA
jgi:ubiquinone/menaquinone biosynthesis C-methylase UbiE